MIALLTGTLALKEADRVVVKTTSGVGYECFVPTRSLASLPAPGQSVELFTHLAVREDALTLFGFATAAERQVFQRLMTVSGVGPRLALALLSQLSAERIVRAIRERDLAALSSVSGVGKKTAERVVLELKDKTDDLLRVIAVSTWFGPRRVLKDVDLAVRRGEIFVVMGPSGCGKTTLLRHLCGLSPPTVGTVSVEGRDLYLMSPAELSQFRMRSGMSFQGGALLNSVTLIENVALPLRENTDLPPDVILEVARMKLDMVGLLHAEALLPSSLSGGMRKRAAVARAIALDPEIVFLDEPTAGLDPPTSAGIDNLILKLNKVFGITMVVVTHDLDLAFSISDRIAMILEGSIAKVGSKDEIRAAEDPRVQEFVRRQMHEEAAASLDVTRYLAM